MQALGRLAIPSTPPTHGRNARALRAGRGHEPAEIAAFDELHGEQQALVAEVLELVDLDHVRVVQTCGEVRLLDEHRAEAPRAAVGRQDPLEDEELVSALGAALLGQEDLGHAARAQAAHDLEVGDLWRRRRRGALDELDRSSLAGGRSGGYVLADVTPLRKSTSLHSLFRRPAAMVDSAANPTQAHRERHAREDAARRSAAVRAREEALGTLELLAPDRRVATVRHRRTGQPLPRCARASRWRTWAGCCSSSGFLTEEQLTRSLADLAKQKARRPALHGEILVGTGARRRRRR